MHAVGSESAVSPKVWFGGIVELEPSASSFNFLVIVIWIVNVPVHAFLLAITLC